MPNRTQLINQLKDFFQNPIPRFALLALSLALLTQICLGSFGVHYFFERTMGWFLCLLAANQLRNLTGFVNSFKKYNFLTKHWPFYGSLYPFLEIGFGLFFITCNAGLFTNIFALLFIMETMVGVLNAYLQGTSLKCACLGIRSDAPDLGLITITENLMMLWMFLFNGLQLVGFGLWISVLPIPLSLLGVGFSIRYFKNTPQPETAKTQNTEELKPDHCCSRNQAHHTPWLDATKQPPSSSRQQEDMKKIGSGSRPTTP